MLRNTGWIALSSVRLVPSKAVQKLRKVAKLSTCPANAQALACFLTISRLVGLSVGGLITPSIICLGLVKKYMS